jgi:hypothetical protein
MIMCCRIDQARLCQECRLVTVDEKCDLCGKATSRHPESDAVQEQYYCLDCAEEITREQAIVRTWKDDAYQQLEDGMLITVCEACEHARVAEIYSDDE